MKRFTTISLLILLLLVSIVGNNTTRANHAPLRVALASNPAAPPPNAPTGPFLSIYPGSFNVIHTNPPEITFDILTIENTSSDFINYSLHTALANCDVPDAPAWLFVSSGGGSLPPFSLEQLQVQFSSEGLVNGTYQALICVRDTSHPQNPYYQVFVQLTVAAPETATPEPPTVTPEPPTLTPEPPTLTPEVPTATPEVPTATPEAPTATPEAPTVTPEPPTITPEVPTATPSNTPPPGATLTPTPSAPATARIYLPLTRRR
jgi:hypothetical protein